MKTFIEFLQDRVGAKYSFRDIIDNLTDDDVLFEIDEYIQYKNGI